MRDLNLAPKIIDFHSVYLLKVVQHFVIIKRFPNVHKVLRDLYSRIFVYNLTHILLTLVIVVDIMKEMLHSPYSKVVLTVTKDRRVRTKNEVIIFFYFKGREQNRGSNFIEEQEVN